MSKSTLGTLLLIWGILAWIVYYGLKFLTKAELPFALFLAWHLAGVVPGALLRGKRRAKRLIASIRKIKHRVVRD